MSDFSVTEAAFKRISQILVGEPAEAAFIVEVQGGGCSGFQYHFSLQKPEDVSKGLLIENSSARVFVTEQSLPLLNGSHLDYEEDLASAGFAIKNPNAVMKCGCGNSFSVSM